MYQPYSILAHFFYTLSLSCHVCLIQPSIWISAGVFTSRVTAHTLYNSVNVNLKKLFSIESSFVRLRYCLSGYECCQMMSESIECIQLLLAASADVLLSLCSHCFERIRTWWEQTISKHLGSVSSSQIHHKNSELNRIKCFLNRTRYRTRTVPNYSERRWVWSMSPDWFRPLLGIYPTSVHMFMLRIFGLVLCM